VTELNAEAAWVKDAQAGSANAFGRLVHMHQQGLRAFLRRLSVNPADADDLAQETFVFAWEHIERFDPARPFRPWLFGIGWRKYRERKRGWLRLLTREGRAAATETSFVPDPGLKLDLVKAAQSLAPEQRAAVLLCLGAEFTHAEAAETLALPLGTVKSHVARGREKLVAALGGSDG
jgi:RNA polymerase sigma factor (sigma-70 family)